MENVMVTREVKQKNIGVDRQSANRRQVQKTKLKNNGLQ